MKLSPTVSRLLSTMALVSAGACGKESNAPAEIENDASLIDAPLNDASSNDAMLIDAASFDGAVGDGLTPDAQTPDTATTMWGDACPTTPSEEGDNGGYGFVDFIVQAEALDKYEGKLARVRTDAQSVEKILGADERTVIDGAFVVTWTSSKGRGNYQFFYGYVDDNDSGLCEPGADLVWFVSTDAFAGGPSGNEAYVLQISETMRVAVTEEDQNKACSVLNAC